MFIIQDMTRDKNIQWMKRFMKQEDISTREWYEMSGRCNFYIVGVRVGCYARYLQFARLVWCGWGWAGGQKPDSGSNNRNALLFMPWPVEQTLPLN